MRLYIEGHHVRLGHVISREYSVDEIRAIGPCEPEQPVRYYKGSLRDARRMVDRWNRMFATHGEVGDDEKEGRE